VTRKMTSKNALNRLHLENGLLMKTFPQNLVEKYSLQPIDIAIDIFEKLVATDGAMDIRTEWRFFGKKMSLKFWGWFTVGGEILFPSLKILSTGEDPFKFYIFSLFRVTYILANKFLSNFILSPHIHPHKYITTTKIWKDYYYYYIYCIKIWKGYYYYLHLFF